MPFFSIGFVGSAAMLLNAALPCADWSRLARADWASCWASAPTLLQLHVYAEIVPTVCESLGHERPRVRRALLGGSLMLLAVQLAWSTLGIAAVPYDATGLRTDPVDALLTRGGSLSAATTAAGRVANGLTMVCGIRRVVTR